VWIEWNIDILGMCDVGIETSKNLTMATFYVVKGKARSWPRYRTTSDMNIIKMVNKVETLSDEIKIDFSRTVPGYQEVERATDEKSCR
jgi:hypothetical protein